MRAIVVAKTRMGQNLCVGAVDEADGRFLRLIPRDGAEYHSWQRFDEDVGAVIDLTGQPSNQVTPPHVEDYVVNQKRDTGERIAQLSDWIRGKCNVWTGNRANLFGGRMKFTSYGKGHVDRGDPLPFRSVGFWEIPASMSLDAQKKRYAMAGGQPVNAAYVGVATPVPTLARNTLIRVSLARWWAPDDGSLPEACWLQISGFYQT